MNGTSGVPCAAPREGVIHTKITTIEENQAEIQSRVENLFERLNNRQMRTNSNRHASNGRAAQPSSNAAGQNNRLFTRHFATA